MPTYQYECTKCGERFDVFQSFAEEPLKKHPGKCRGKVVKVLSAAGIVFSGSGFYKTDNRSASKKNGSGKSSDSSKSDSGSSSDSSSSSSSSSPSSSGSSGGDSAKPAAANTPGS